MTQSPSRQPGSRVGQIKGKSDDGWEVLDEKDEEGEKERVQPDIGAVPVDVESKEDLEGSILGEERDEGWEEARREA